MTDNTLYADIAIDITSRNLEKTFQYRIPESMLGQVVPGSTVEIPFGNGGRVVKGYVLGLSDRPVIEEERIKDIASVVTGSELVESALVKLAAWMSHNYGSTLASALRVVFPVKGKIGKKEVKFLSLAGDETLWTEKLTLYEKKHQIARLRLLRELMEQKEIPRGLVTDKLGCSSSVIKALVEQGVCAENSKRIYRNTMGRDEVMTKGHVLNEGQRRAVEGILSDFRAGNGGVSLIRGVTGSGKTEVYIDIVEEVVRSGKQAIVLIPEISLTYQTVMRFYRRFGDRVATLHSRLSPGERYDQFERARRGELDVVIGPRSALFAPLAKLGIIVIDEEHEGSYKSEQTPKYHARETAIERARLCNALVVLGSATPSVDSYYRAQKGEYKLYEMTERATGGVLPDVEIVDLREELKAGNKTPFSRALVEKIRDRLSRKEQVMLFLNRRGYAGFLSCRACGKTVRCPHCDVSLSIHRNGRLICHYCGYSEPYIKECKSCGSKYVGAMKAGTEAIELFVQRTFPEAKCLRMDMDTTRGKDGHEKILAAFANQEADILIGTQMIVKGHDFPKVTLVGAIVADMSLHASDYRAGERTFELLTQAAGRAGRGDRPGEVVIQTYSPEDPHIVASAKQDYIGFYNQEIAYRQLLDYPPAHHMLAVLFESPSKDRAEKTAKDMAGKAAGLATDIFSEKKIPVRIIGPSPASIAYINDIYRQVLYVKSEEYENLVLVKDMIEQEFMGRKQGNVNVFFDFDPQSGY